MNNFEIALKFSACAEKYTESKLGCLGRTTCLAWVAMNCPAPSPLPAFFFVQNALPPLASNFTLLHDEAGGGCY